MHQNDSYKMKVLISLSNTYGEFMSYKALKLFSFFLTVLVAFSSWFRHA